MDSGRGGVGKDSVFFKGLSTRNLTMLQSVYGEYKLYLIFFSSFVLGEVTRVGLDPGRLGNECDHGALSKISK